MVGLVLNMTKQKSQSKWQSQTLYQLARLIHS